MSNIQLVFDPIKTVRTITKIKNGCTTNETQTEYLVPYDCKAGDKMILFLKVAAKAANAGGVIVGDVITRTYENGQYKYFVQYADSDLGDGVAPNTLTQCDILKVCCYGCDAEYSDRTNLTSVDAGCGIVVNDDGEFEANTSGVWGEGELLIANGDGPFTDGGEVYCGDDGELRVAPPHKSETFQVQVDGSGAGPFVASVDLVNPSTARRMRVTGFAAFRAIYVTAGTGSVPEATIEASLDAENLFGPATAGTFSWDSGNPISSTFMHVVGLGYSSGNEIELEPGETKTLVITYDTTIAGADVISSAHLEVNLNGQTID